MVTPLSRQTRSLFFVNPHGQVSAHGQLKSQIKLALTFGQLLSGDVLPSIRDLARQVDVGDGVVRRAYRELCETGVLRTHRRKHVVATPAQPTALEAVRLAQTGAEQVDRLMVWAGEARLSAIALGRLLQVRALAREVASPSYVFVDVCSLAAGESAARIARAWDINVAGVSIADFANLPAGHARGLSAILVHQCLFDDVKLMVGGEMPGVFAVKMRLVKRLEQRLRKLTSRSSVLVVFSDQQRPGNGDLHPHCDRLLGHKRRIKIKALSEIPDLAALVRARRYSLVLLSPFVWEQMPRITRMATVARLVTEPHPQALEELRIAAGVLL